MIGEVAGLAAAACWAVGSLLFERIGKIGASAGAMSLGKTASACVVLFLASWASQGHVGPSGATPRDLTLLGVSGVVGLAIGDTAFFASIVRIGAPRAVLLLSSAPVFTVAIESALAGALPPARELVGVALALSGIAMVVARRGPGTIPRDATGVWLGALSGLCQAAGSLMSRAATQGAIDPLTASWGRLLTGALALAAAAAVSGHLAGWVRELGRGTTFLRIGGASFVGTVCGLFLSQVALARSVSAGVASTMLATSPVFALPLAHFARTERATPRAVFGVVLSIAGIAVLMLHP